MNLFLLCAYTLYSLYIIILYIGRKHVAWGKIGMRIYYNEIVWFGDIGCCSNQKGGNCFMFIIKRKVIAV